MTVKTVRNMTDDVLAIWVGLLIFSSALLIGVLNRTDGASRDAKKTTHPLAGQILKPSKWESNPLDAFFQTSPRDKSTVSNGTPSSSTVPTWPKLLTTMAVLTVAFALVAALRGKSFAHSVLGLAALSFIALAAFVIAEQSTMNRYSLEYPLWGLAIGLVLANVFRVPHWLRQAAHSEFYIKIGLVLMGAEILFSKLLARGIPGIMVAWVVTPIVLVTTYWFGQRILKMQSRSLNIVISADMSVCGVSAAIATAAACRAKKEELSLAVGLSMTFTVVMMVVMPIVVKTLNIDVRVAGAWFGGTIDSSAAVVAAATVLGDEAKDIAVTIKLIQNVLIGFIAFAVAVYWARYSDGESGSANHGQPQSLWSEVWRRFPKFIIGFLLASIIASWLFASSDQNQKLVEATISAVTKPLREWMFSLAFVSIGLETSFRVLLPHLRSGKPVLLYVCGQSLNLLLTLMMAWIAFGWLFP